MLRAALLAAALLPAPARADLDFTQVTQAQTSAGAEGLFGKTWVEIRGPRMRLVSGYARKLSGKGGTPDPTRRVQILDVKERTRTVVDTAKRAYAVGELTPPDYGAGLENVLERGKAEWRIVSHEVKLERRPGVRKFLGADCERWRVVVTMRLSSLNGREEAARMDQHLWVAPISGDLARSLMELIAFENAYREGTGGALSPLDHERYQVREAAAYLRVPEAELAKVVAAVREKLRELPSYPVASSVAWWRDEGRSVRPPDDVKPKPAREGVSLGDVKPRPPRPQDRPKHPPFPARGPHAAPAPRPPAFKVINWRRAEKRINGLYRQTRHEFGDFPLGPFREPRVYAEDRPRAAAEAPPRVYPRFEEELHRILDELVKQQAAIETAAAADRAAESAAAGPFFEIYAELHGLERPSDVSQTSFALPKTFKKVDAAALRPTGI